MTDRTLLAVAVPALPLLACLLVAALPSQRAGERLALVSAVPTVVLAVATGVWALIASGDPVLGRWLCVDAAGGVLVGVVGVVGAASLAISPAYLTTTPRSLFGERRAARPLLLGAARLLGRPPGRTARREPRRGVAARRGDDRGLGAPGRVLGSTARTRGGVEVPRPHLRRARRGAARPARPAARPASRGRARGPRVHDHPCRRPGARPPARAARLPAPARRSGREDRLGSRAQLAAGRPLRGPGSGLGPALGRPATDRAARRLARASRPSPRASAPPRRATCSCSSASPRWPWPCLSCGGRSRGSGCSRTRASSTWA